MDAEAVRTIRSALVRRAAGARFVLIGEATHGSHEFYRERAELTKRLIEGGHIDAVAVEGDWPDAYRVNRYVRGESDDDDAVESLAGFRRFPAWMWRNADVAEFVDWLRGWNDHLEAGSQTVGFYGLDLYSLHTSMEAVVDYLDDVDPAAAERARQRYACFDHFGPDPQTYANETGVGGGESCEREVVGQLLELQRIGVRAADAGLLDSDRAFYAEQNARLVVNAERYYRAAFRAGADSWNLRDRHMGESLEALAAHLGTGSRSARIAVWAHNSHVGDARATELGRSGELNLGQLVRERHPGRTLLVGFTTHSGTVTAADNWGGDADRKHVRPALHGSWEHLFHETGSPRFLVATEGLVEERLERAIGVIYRPQTERRSHYFHASLGRQFDVVVHIDQTTALEPLDRTSRWEIGELPETYPWTI